MTISTGVVNWEFNLPIDKLTRKTNFQGADLAVDPRDGVAYLFQAQVNPVGPGEIEDLWIHRYRMDALLKKPVFVDSMYIKGVGHIQTHHVRISIKGNPYVWLGFENYDKDHKRVSKTVHRCLFRSGSFPRNHPNFQKVFTGPGASTDVCGNDEDFTIVIRRGKAKTDEFEWYEEKELLARTSDKVALKPVKELIVPKHNTTAQTWCSSGPFNAEPPNAFRFNGLSGDPSVVTEFSKCGHAEHESLLITHQYDVTKALYPGADPATFEEAEMLFVHKGVCYFGKQFNRGAKRVLGFFSIR